MALSFCARRSGTRINARRANLLHGHFGEHPVPSYDPFWETSRSLPPPQRSGDNLPRTFSMCLIPAKRGLVAALALFACVFSLSTFALAFQAEAIPAAQ